MRALLMIFVCSVTLAAQQASAPLVTNPDLLAALIGTDVGTAHVEAAFAGSHTQQDDLRSWIGRSETIHDAIYPTPVAALTVATAVRNRAVASAGRSSRRRCRPKPVNPRLRADATVRQRQR